MKINLRFTINLFSIVLFSYYFLSKCSFYYISGQSIFYPEVDNFYWLSLALNIPQVISNSELISIFLDLTILFSSIYLLFRENVHIGRILSLVWLLFFIQFNLVSFHHYHSLVGILFLSLMNCFKTEMNKWIVYELIRYYFLFSFFSAGLWKLFRGNIFFEDQFTAILKVQNVEFFTNSQMDFNQNTILFLINNPKLSFILLILATLLELVYIIGYFTKKFDKHLFLIMLIFSFSNWFLMNIFNWEYALFSVVLLPFLRIYRPKETN